MPDHQTKKDIAQLFVQYAVAALLPLVGYGLAKISEHDRLIAVVETKGDLQYREVVRQLEEIKVQIAELRSERGR